MGAAPSALHRGEAKVPDFHRQTFVQEDVFTGCQGIIYYAFTHTHSDRDV